MKFNENFISKTECFILKLQNLYITQVYRSHSKNDFKQSGVEIPFSRKLERSIQDEN